MAENNTEKTNACGACLLRARCTAVSDNKYSCRQRWKALFLGYILPFIFLAAAIVLTDLLSDNEALIGGVALGVVALYYLILFAKKPKI